MKHLSREIELPYPLSIWLNGNKYPDFFSMQVHILFAVSTILLSEYNRQYHYFTNLFLSQPQSFFRRQVKRDARIGQAEAKKDSGIREAIAEEQRMASRYFNDTKIALARR